MIEYKTSKTPQKIQTNQPFFLRPLTIRIIDVSTNNTTNTTTTSTTTTTNTTITTNTTTTGYETASSAPPTLPKPLPIMSSTFSQGVMVSLNEHMAQTLLDSMTSTIRSKKLDTNMQIQGLEMLVENLEALNARVARYMGELKEAREDMFCFDELDLEGLEEWVDNIGGGVGGVGRERERVQRIPSPIGVRGSKAKLASRRLTTLCEEDLTSRPSFETINSFSSSSSSSSNHSANGSITIKVDMPSTPPPSSYEQTLFTPSTPAQYRQIDPKKIPKRKPVPATQLQIPQKSGGSGGGNKAFRRKEVPKRMYEQQGSDVSSTTVNTIATSSVCADTCGKMGVMWTPPVTDEECSPIRDRGDSVCIATAATAAAATAMTIYQPKPRRVKSKQLKITVPRKGSGGKGSGCSVGKEKTGKVQRTPTSASGGATGMFSQRRGAVEDSSIRFSYEESEGGRVVKRTDSGKEKRKSMYGASGSVKRKLSLKSKRRRRYENGIPRCDSPVLGSSFEVVFARR